MCLHTAKDQSPLSMVGKSLDPFKTHYQGLCRGDLVQLPDQSGVLRECRCVGCGAFLSGGNMSVKNLRTSLSVHTRAWYPHSLFSVVQYLLHQPYKQKMDFRSVSSSQLRQNAPSTLVHPLSETCSRSVILARSYVAALDQLIRGVDVGIVRHVRPVAPSQILASIVF